MNETASDSSGSLSRGLAWLLAIGTGLVVANLYYIQPLMGEVARDFQVREAVIGYSVMLGQAGLALGTMTILPLGDITDRRRLIMISCVLVSLSLMVMALSPNPWILLAGTFILGATSVATHLQVSYAAHLASPEQRGKTVGMVMSGLLIGILLARTVSGYAALWVSWRVIFGGASVGMLLLGIALNLKLPKDDEIHRIRYGKLLSSMPRLFFHQPVLRDACIYGALTFAAFNGFWATLTFHLEAPPFEMTPHGIGVFSLVAVAGALAANGAGYLTAYVKPIRIVAASLLLTLFSFGIFWGGGYTLAGMVIGIVVMDLGIQATHISNQTMIHSLMPQARNRIHCIYMTTYFLGGAVGSGAGTWGFARWGWPGLCIVASMFILAAIVYWGLRRVLK